VEQDAAPPGRHRPQSRDKERRHHATLTFGRTEVSHPRAQGGATGRGSLRFVFYGRVSTEDWQDPVTSQARQREHAGVLVAGHGTIVAEFFDAGQSRTLPWMRGAAAAALVAALADPDRGGTRS
jgi:hypothetical protein